MIDLCGEAPTETDVTLAWFEELAAKFNLPPHDLSGPVIEEPEPWDLVAPPLKELVSQLAHTDNPTDYLFTRAQLDDYLKKMEETSHADADPAGPSDDGPKPSAAANGGGASVPGGPEDGEPVDKGREAAAPADTGQSSKSPRRGRAGAASRRRK